MFTLDDYSTLNVLLAAGISLFCGIVVAAVYWFRNPSHSKALLITLVVLPVIVQSVIMMISGYAMIGVGIAVAGAFNLVRFRSTAGSSSDIAYVFLAMSVGVASGVGQVGYAMVFTGLVALIFFAYKFMPFARRTECIHARNLNVTCPDDVDFDKEFADIFTRHTTETKTNSIRTSKMGSLYEIRYTIKLKSDTSEKALIDELRIKNANLPIICRAVKEQEDEF